MVLKRKIEQVIQKGGHVGADLGPDKKSWMNFTLRIRKEMLTDIDVALEKTAGLSKTGFILQAVQEKLKRTE
jgi:hypothetical protein